MVAATCSTPEDGDDYSDANGDESGDEDAAGGEYEYYDEGLDTCRWLQVVYFAGCRSSGLGPCRWLQIDGRQLLQAAAFAKKRCGDGELQKPEPKRKQLDADGRSSSIAEEGGEGHPRDTPIHRHFGAT